MDVSGVLKQAWEAVEKADLPEEIQPIAFKEAVRLLHPSGPPAAAAQRQKPPGGARASTGEGVNGEGGSTITVSEDEIYERVATHTGADRDKLEQIVHLDGDNIRLSVPGIKLGKNNAERTRAVAQIITITRGFGLEETETSLEIIRAECDRLKVYDQANFSAHVKALQGYVITGTGTNRRVRAKGPGITAFPALINTIMGES